MKTTRWPLGLSLFLATSLLWAQTSFEIVSVKPNNSGSAPSAPVASPGRFTWVGATVLQLIQTAYDRRPYQIVGMPEWANTTQFDVMAISPRGSSLQQMNAMLQGVLAERFGLVVHGESRDLPVYTLELAHRDRRLGANARPSTIDCKAILSQPLTSAGARVDNEACIPQMGLARLKASGVGMSFLAEGLMRILDRSVLDRTSLAGTFDVELSWTPDPTMLPSGATGTSVAPGGPSIFTALEEQLGLRLVSGRGSVPVLVIDRLSRPTPD